MIAAMAARRSTTGFNGRARNETGLQASGKMRNMSDFRLESELFEILEHSSSEALRKLTRAHAAVVSHPMVGGMVPDLVVVASRRLPVTAASITYFEASLIAGILGQTPVTCEQMANALFAPIKTVDRTVRKLVRLQFLAEVSGGVHPRYGLVHGSLPLSAEVVAVEAKLTRWREALGQARDYLRFANRSFIAMPAALVRRNIELLDACAQAGVGAVAVDAHCAEIVLAAPRHVVFNAEWLRIVSREMNTFSARRHTPGRLTPSPLDAAAPCAG